MMQKTTVVEYWTITSEQADQRIDNFLVARLKGVPKTHIYKLLRKGEVRVNKKRSQPSYRLAEGDILRIPPIRLDMPKVPVTPHQSLVSTLKNRILYEDNQLLIINKPSGIAVHGGSGVRMGLIEALKTMYPKCPQLELAHRLDLETSGCLILAKKRSVLREVHELLRNGEMTKIYWALTKGHWKKSELRVEVSLHKNHLSSGERIVKVDQEGKPSLTVFQPIEIYKNASLVSAQLHTGRTHQIRVHCQYRGHPIAGDDKYGDREFNKTMRQLGLKRLFLHASKIEFTLPSRGEKISVSAALDDGLEDCLDLLREK